MKYDMDNLFYAHLVPLDQTLDKLGQFVLTDEQRLQLEDIILSSFHHKMIETILMHLDPKHHELAVQYIAQDPHNLEIMIWLKSLNSDIEEQMILAGQELGEQMHGLLLKQKKSGDK